MRPKVKEKQLSTRVRKEVYDEIYKVAYEKDIYPSQLLRWVIEKYLVEELKVRW